MSTPITTPMTPPVTPPPATPNDATTPPPTPAPTPTETPAEEAPKGNPNSEAAKYRVRAQAAEAEQTKLAGQLEQARRGIVADVLTRNDNLVEDPDAERVNSLHNPADLWDVLGATPDQFFTDDGNLDREALAAYVAEHTAERTYLTRPPATQHRSLQHHYASMLRPTPAHAHERQGVPETSGDAWVEALRPSS